MSVVRFISDLHFGHESMSIRRGFKNVIEHDEYIINKWNSVVNKKDTTYILGDITMETTKHYYRLDQLNGNKKVILGNHDLINHSVELLKYVDFVGGIVKYKQKGFEKVFLSHCPIHPRELEYRVSYNIHGHLHEHDIIINKIIGKNNKTIQVKDNRYINVSCEQIDYTPIEFNKLFK